MSPRNVFERNGQNLSEEDQKVVGNEPHVLLPPLAGGHEYTLTKLPSGRSAVTVVQSSVETCTCGPGEACSNCPKPETDQFGRHYTR